MYRVTKDKEEKTDLSRCVVEQICARGGRFVKLDPLTRHFYVLTNDEARIKTAQALRENRDSKSSSSDDNYDCVNNAAAVENDDRGAAVEVEATPTKSLDNASFDCVAALFSLRRQTSRSSQVSSATGGIH